MILNNELTNHTEPKEIFHQQKNRNKPVHLHKINTTLAIVFVAKDLHKQNLNVWKESRLLGSWLHQSYSSNISQIEKDSGVLCAFNFTTNTGNVSSSKQINTFDELDCEDEIDGYKLCALG